MATRTVGKPLRNGGSWVFNAEAATVSAWSAIRPRIRSTSGLSLSEIQQSTNADMLFHVIVFVHGGWHGGISKSLQISLPDRQVSRRLH